MLRLRLGEIFRQQAQAGGEWIITAANNDPYPPRMMRQHQAQDVLRAIETNRWLVRATNTGISGVINPQGRILWQAPPGAEFNSSGSHLPAHASDIVCALWGLVNSRFRRNFNHRFIGALGSAETEVWELTPIH